MEIMETVVKSMAVNEVTTPRRNPREYVCWGSGETGHLLQDCPHKNTEKDGPDPKDPAEIVGYAFTNVHTKKPVTDKGWMEMMKQMNKLEWSDQVYRAGI